MSRLPQAPLSLPHDRGWPKERPTCYGEEGTGLLPTAPKLDSPDIAHIKSSISYRARRYIDDIMTFKRKTLFGYFEEYM